MTNIVRYDPFGEAMGFAPLWSPASEWLRGFLARPFGFEGALWGEPGPFRIAVAENETEYQVTAELPGARKEDVNVSVNGAEVTISAEIRDGMEGGREWDTVYSERLCGKMQRTFTLDHEIDADKAEARYTDGVLRLILPKKQPESRKRLTVH
jgi:HSP20 family protein